MGINATGHEKSCSLVPKGLIECTINLCKHISDRPVGFTSPTMNSFDQYVRVYIRMCVSAVVLFCMRETQNETMKMLMKSDIK